MGGAEGGGGAERKSTSSLRVVWIPWMLSMWSLYDVASVNRHSHLAIFALDIPRAGRTLPGDGGYCVLQSSMILLSFSLTSRSM